MYIIRCITTWCDFTCVECNHTIVDYHKLLVACCMALKGGSRKVMHKPSATSSLLWRGGAAVACVLVCMWIGHSLSHKPDWKET